LAAAVSLFATLSASAENWPRFRGPSGQGISTEKNLPTEWSADSNIRWKTEIPGEGWSSPIVWGNHVFVTTITDEGTRCRVLALDRKSGKVLWNTEVFEQVPLRKEGKNSYATPTPVTDGRQVYAVFGDGSAVALNFKGKILWTNREVEFYSRHGLGSSPILHGNLLIMPYDGSNRIGTAGNWPNVSNEERLGWQIPWDKATVVAFDTKTGKRVWTGKRGMSRISHVTPLVLKVDGKEQLISPAGDQVQGFDPKTGELIWSVYSQGEGVTPSPAYSDKFLFTSSGFEKTTLRAVRLGGAKNDATETHIAWEQRKGVPTQPSLIYVAPHVYAITDGGIVTCFNGADGEIVYQERGGGNHSASPLYANGKLYFLSESGETTVVQAGSDFRILARNSLDERVQASLAASQGNLFLRTSKHLYCIGK
jgi:outer membrane protein assembly factor BamB